MRTKFIKYFVGLFVLFVLLSSHNVFAACSADGYTIVYVNGINTPSEEDAKIDTGLLEDKFKEHFSISEVHFFDGYNPSHLAVVGDVVETASQILNNPISDYDLKNILLQIYPEITTRKILLVGHSQGTFYTNEIYDYLIKHGESKESVGVYNVATPAGSVAGTDPFSINESYLTSINDNVINGVRILASKFGAKQPLPANITVPPVTEDSLGHSFSKVYLEKASAPIVSGIENALKKLSTTETSNIADGSCFIPPAKDILYYEQKFAFGVVDSTAAGVIATAEDINTVGTAVNNSVSVAVAQTIDSAKGIVSVIANTVKDIAGAAKNNAQIPNQNLLAEVSLDNSADQSVEQKIIGPSLAVQPVESDQISIKDENILPDEIIKDETVVDKKPEETQEVKQIIASSTPEKLIDTDTVQDEAQIQAPQIKNCSFDVTGTATHQNLIINEVAWMGSSKSANDEWIELKNISNSELDISNWQILDKGEQVKTVIPENTKIAAGGFLLMERTDDDSVPNVDADIIYTGALSNSDEGLRLFDNKCNLVDEVLANSEWPAGDAAAKRTMERQADLTWSTYSGAGEGNGDALILGTPKKENTIKVVYYGVGGGGATAAAAAAVETNNNSNVQPSKILISEVQITGGTGKSNNDFIELYNPNDSKVNLKGCRLVKRTKTGTADTSIKSWTDDAFIEAKSFYLWANSDYADISASPDITTSGSLANDNGVALRFGAEDTGVIIDSVAWGAAANSLVEKNPFAQNPGANQSIQRKIQNGNFADTDDNASDFELTTCPNPKTQSNYCAVSETNESNQAPSAFFDFSPATPEVGEVINFNAASSTDADGNIALYDWNFGDSSVSSGQVTSTTTTAATTHIYSLAGDYNISLTIFDNFNATSTYVLPISVASSTVQQDDFNQQASSTGHILISEIMPSNGAGKSDEEFVELYNPTSSEIDLSGYYLKVRNSFSSTSTAYLVNSNKFASSIIPANGFLLIASGEYASSTQAVIPDILYSNSSNHLANNDYWVVLYNAEEKVVDEFYYTAIDEGKSLERKALWNDLCVSAQGEGEFAGNGCDMDSANDFEVRNIPNPQNSQNLPEPRSIPTAPQNFSGQYDKVNKKINLSWDASSDYSGATSTLSYLVSDVSVNPVLGSITTSSTTAEFNINEAGRDYIFNILVRDKEGLTSGTSTTTVSVPGISIEDIDYAMVSQINHDETSSGEVAQVFRPAATGVLNSITMRMFGGVWGHSDVHLYIYEWRGDASSSPEAGKGALLAESVITDITPNTLNYAPEQTWNFNGASSIVLEKGKYYFLETKNAKSSAYPDYQTAGIGWYTGNGGSLIDGDAWHGTRRINDLYLVINAVKNGAISLQEPINNQVYYDTNLNYKIRYVEPIDKKYDRIIIDTSDFLTGAPIESSRIITLSDSEQTIGWHEINRISNINNAGYFKTKASLSDSIKSENYFSIFGVMPLDGKLLNQNSYGDSGVSSDHFSGQVFRPAVSGKIDSLTFKVTSGDPNIVQGHAYWSIYEWNGNGNDLDGSAGALLATTTPKFLIATTYYPGPVEETWDLDSNNEIDLDANKYYFLTLSIVSDSPSCTFDCRPAMLYMAGSSNGSLIDGRLITPYVTGGVPGARYINQGDLYLILNKKV